MIYEETRKLKKLLGKQKQRHLTIGKTQPAH